MSGNPFIKVGSRMKSFIVKVIKRDFGNVSVPLGLYHILRYWDSLPKSEKKKVISRVENRRMSY